MQLKFTAVAEALLAVLASRGLTDGDKDDYHKLDKGGIENRQDRSEAKAEKIKSWLDPEIFFIFCFTSLLPVVNTCLIRLMVIRSYLSNIFLMQIVYRVNKAAV